MVVRMSNRAFGIESTQSLATQPNETTFMTSLRHSESSATATIGITPLTPSYNAVTDDMEQARTLRASNHPSPSFSFADDMPVSLEPEAFNDALTGMVNLK